MPPEEQASTDTLLTSETPAVTTTTTAPAVDLAKTGSAMDAALGADAAARDAAAAQAATDEAAKLAKATVTDDGKTKDGEAELTPEQKATAEAEAKAKADAEAADHAPEAYEAFKLPETIKMDDIVLGEFQSLAKELDLTQEKAQKLVDIGARMQAGNVQAIKNVIDTQAKAWRAETVADAEVGGDAIDKNMAVAKAALDEFGTPALKTLLAQTKLGSHPEVVRLLFRAGQAISQDGFIPGRQRGTGGDTASTLYPSSAKK